MAKRRRQLTLTDEIRYFLKKKSALPDITGLIATSKQVTERKNAERAKESQFTEWFEREAGIRDIIEAARNGSLQASLTVIDGGYRSLFPAFDAELKAAGFHVYSDNYGGGVTVKWDHHVK